MGRFEIWKMNNMLAYTYISPGKFELIDKPKPELQSPRDDIVRITLGSICTSDLHIKHGSVPRAIPNITIYHEKKECPSKPFARHSFSHYITISETALYNPSAIATKAL